MTLRLFKYRTRITFFVWIFTFLLLNLFFSGIGWILFCSSALSMGILFKIERGFRVYRGYVVDSTLPLCPAEQKIIPKNDHKLWPIPNEKSRSRKDFICSYCQAKFKAGSDYRYLKNNKKPNAKRVKFCETCSDNFPSINEISRQKEGDYQSQVADKEREISEYYKKHSKDKAEYLVLKPIFPKLLKNWEDPLSDIFKSFYILYMAIYVFQLFMNENSSRKQGSGISTSILSSSSNSKSFFKENMKRKVPKSLILPRDEGSSGCDLSIMGGKSREDFDLFDKSIRQAAKNNKLDDLLSLVKLPLEWHVDERTIIIKTIEELQSNANNIFSEKIKKDIRKKNGFFCNWTGLTYGQGSIWISVNNVNGKDIYKISSVNSGVLDENNLPSLKKPETFLKCATEKHSIVVDAIGTNKIRYRSWLVGRNIEIDKADLVLNDPVIKSEGSGLCRYDIYQFKNGKHLYQLSGMGCGSFEDIPEGTVSELEVFKGETSLGRWPCKSI